MPSKLRAGERNRIRKNDAPQVFAMSLALVQEAVADVEFAIKQRDKRAEILARVRLERVVPMLADGLASVAM